jgi:hypothetical protein
MATAFFFFWQFLAYRHRKWQLLLGFGFGACTLHNAPKAGSDAPCELRVPELARARPSLRCAPFSLRRSSSSLPRLMRLRCNSCCLTLRDGPQWRQATEKHDIANGKPVVARASDIGGGCGFQSRPGPSAPTHRGITPPSVECRWPVRFTDNACFICSPLCVL